MADDPFPDAVEFDFTPDHGAPEPKLHTVIWSSDPNVDFLDDHDRALIEREAGRLFDALREHGVLALKVIATPPDSIS